MTLRKLLCFYFIAFGFSVEVIGVIPVSHIKGVDELFLPQFKIYSPLTGMLFHDTYIAKTLRLEPSQPIARLAGLLFNEITEEEIVVTSLMNAPGSHLSPGLIGRFYRIYETLKAQSLQESEFRARLAMEIKEAFTSDPDYMQSVSGAEREIEIATMEFEAKRSDPNLTMNAEERERARREFKSKKALNDVSGPKYQAKLTELANLLADCFLTHSNGTVIILNAYQWKKYVDKLSLRRFLETALEAGFLYPTARERLTEKFYQTFYTKEDYHLIGKRIPALSRAKWVEENFTDAVVTALEEGGEVSFPHLTPFIRALWVLYSRYPDCCEIVIHNIFNMIAFNTQIGDVDSNILVALWKNFYPHMSEKVIGYYEKYPTLASQESIPARRDWLEIMTNLNAGCPPQPQCQQILYDDERAQCEILPPVSNIFAVVFRLLGYEDIATDHMAEIFARVQEVSGFPVVYHPQQAKKKDEETALFSVGTTRLLLTTISTRHAFVKLQKSRTHRVTKKLCKVFCKGPSRKTKDDPVTRLRFLGAMGALQSHF